MTRNSRLYFPKITIRSGVLALFALALQAAAIYLPLGFDDVPKRILFAGSYVLLLSFVVLNLPRPGLAVIGAGLLLNFLAIAANGGLMPITAENVTRIGEAHRIEGKQEGDAIPRTKNVLKSRGHTSLYPLTDRIVWDNPVVFKIFSVGDVVIAGGLVVTLGDLFLPRLRRETLSPEKMSRANP